LAEVWECGLIIFQKTVGSLYKAYLERPLQIDFLIKKTQDYLFDFARGTYEDAAIKSACPGNQLPAHSH